MRTTQTAAWEVVGAKAYNPGNPADGEEETVIASAPEAEARRVYADTVARAAELEYTHVTLRSAGHDVESWPQATGWTS